MLTATEMELSFAAYQARQHHEVSLEGLADRAARLAPGGKFRFADGTWHPQPYPGHAVVAMVEGVAANGPLADRLRWMQHELIHGFPARDAVYLLPPASFHQTVANTLSDEKHQRLVVDRGLAGSYARQVTDVFAELPPSPSILTTPVSLRLAGLGIFSTAIGALGVFDHEHDFRRVLHFRDHFYGHERIASLGIRRTRPFIGHATIAYLERPLTSSERDRLVDVVAGLNRVIATRDIRFHLPHAELRAYDHLAEFKALPGLPVYRL
jgi:hypothetical protein